MDESLWWIVDIVGPAVLVIVLIWLVIRTQSNRASRESQRSEQGARDVYAEEEQRRREGTDDL
jgi:membrane protein implicated in regulation of membrane protease activity